MLNMNVLLFIIAHSYHYLRIHRRARKKKLSFYVPHPLQKEHFWFHENYGGGGGGR